MQYTNIILVALAAFAAAAPAPEGHPLPDKRTASIENRSVNINIKKYDTSVTPARKAEWKKCLTDWDNGSWHSEFKCADNTWQSGSYLYNSPQNCLTACQAQMEQAIDNNGIDIECNDYEGGFGGHCWMQMWRPSSN